MEKLIKKVLDRYNKGRITISHLELARLITAHMKIGIDGKKGWFLNLSSHNGKYETAEEIIEEYASTR